MGQKLACFMKVESRIFNDAVACAQLRGTEAFVKEKIHPAYEVGTITCACGNTFMTRGTAGDMRVEICSKCHPFFTGKQKLVDSAGRVEKFMRKYKKPEAEKNSTPPQRA